MIRRWAMTGLGLGYAPIASGTFGSAGAIVVALAIWFIFHSLGIGALWLNLAWIILTLSASIGCVLWGPWAIDYFADIAKKTGDPGIVVLDEFAGQWLALLAMPMPGLKQALMVLAIQFFLFRLFDVIKPPPARRLERLPAGWGILTDDLVAAVYANIVGQMVLRFVLS